MGTSFKTQDLLSSLEIMTFNYLRDQMCKVINHDNKESKEININVNVNISSVKEPIQAIVFM